MGEVTGCIEDSDIEYSVLTIFSPTKSRNSVFSQSTVDAPKSAGDTDSTRSASRESSTQEQMKAKKSEISSVSVPVSGEFVEKEKHVEDGPLGHWNFRPRKPIQLRPYYYDRLEWGYLDVPLPSDSESDADFSDDPEVQESADVQESFSDRNLSGNSVNPRKQHARISLIDSSSSEDELSDFSIQSNTKKPARHYRRRITSTVPAALDPSTVNRAPVRNEESDEQFVESLESSSLNLSESLGLLQKTPSSQIEALEIDAIDIMAPPRARRTRDVSLVTVAKLLGPRASKFVRVAARTAKRNGAKPSNPDRKFLWASGIPWDEPIRTLLKWRKGFYINELEPKHNKKEQARFRKASRKPNPLTAAIPAMRNFSEQPKLILDDGKFTSKARKRKYRPPVEYQDAILETDADLYELPRFSKTPRSISLPEIHKKTQQYFTPAKPMSTSSKDVIARSAVIDKLAHTGATKSGLIPLGRLKFDESTFAGSNTLLLLSHVERWNGRVGNEAIGNPLPSNEFKIERDFERFGNIITGQVGNIDEAIYNSCYNWLFGICGYLLDTYNIVSDETRYFISDKLSIALEQALSAKDRDHGFLFQTRLLTALAALVANYSSAQWDLRRQDAFKRVQGRALVLLARNPRQLYICMILSARKSYVGREALPLELLIVLLRLGSIDSALLSLARKSAQGTVNAEKTWLLLLAFACTCQYIKHDLREGWLIVQQLLTPALLHGADRAGLLARCVDLISRWGWQPKPSIVVTFFDFMAKEQHYAEKIGETTDLPDFLCEGRFDGSRRHAGEHYEFLELLGLTLEKLSDATECRRLAARVTPLCTLSFPETEPVTLAQLSAVSLQYGILLVLYRCAPQIARPSIHQIIEHVTLAGAHIVIRLKVLSAWYSLARILLSRNESLQECKEWQYRMARGAVSQFASLSPHMHEASKNLPDFYQALFVYSRDIISRGGSDAISESLFAIFSIGPPPGVLKEGWQVVEQLLMNNTEEADCKLRSISFQLRSRFEHPPPPEDYEYEVWVKVVVRVWGYLGKELLLPWHSLDTEVSVLSGVLRNFLHIGSNDLHYFVEKGAEFIAREDWNKVKTFYNILHQHATWVPFNGDRLEVLEAFGAHWYTDNNVDEADKLLRLIRARYENLVQSKSIIWRNYAGVAALARRVLFSYFPSLNARHKWFDDSGQYYALETMQLNLIEAVRGHKYASLEYFFAFRLNKSLEVDGGESYCQEVLGALSGSRETKDEFNLIINGIIAFQVRAAADEPLLAACVPMLTQLATDAMNLRDRMELTPSEFLPQLAFFIEQRLSYIDTPNILWSAAYQLYRMCSSVFRQWWTAGKPSLSAKLVDALVRSGNLVQLLRRSHDETLPIKVDNPRPPLEFDGDTDALVDTLKDARHPPVTPITPAMALELGHAFVYQVISCKKSFTKTTIDSVKIIELDGSLYRDGEICPPTCN